MIESELDRDISLKDKETPRASAVSGSNERPIRVLTLTTVDITLGKLLPSLIHALKDRGYISECASADGPHAEELRAEGIRVHPITFKRRVFTPSHVLAFLQVFRLMRRGRYDIVHVHTPFAQVIGRMAARLAGVPLVLYTSHGFQFHESRPHLVRSAIKWIERFLGRHTDMVFTQSREDAQTAVEIGIAPAERVLWIGNGIQLHRFTPGPEDRTARSEFGLETDHKIVGFIGRIVREKGVIELIEAMAEVSAAVPDARLLVVGDTLASDGDTAAKALVQSTIDRLGIHDKVRFAGLRDDTPRLLRVMDVFVLPSWREGMPRSIIEAMSTGLPVIATDIRGCREEVVDGETGVLVPPKRADLLAKAIVSLLTDRETAIRMGERGRERALEWFDEAKVVERQLAAYAALLEKKGLLSDVAQ